MAKKSLKNLTVSEADDMRKKIYQEDYFFRASFDVIAKHFLSNFIEGDIFAMPFAEIQSKIIEQTPTAKELSQNEGYFFSSICKEYLDIQNLPSRSLLKYYENASQDIKAIDVNIKEYEAKVTELENKKQKTEEEGYRNRLLRYYIDLNVNAKNQIIDFITDKIKEYALFDCLDHPTFLSIFYHGVPYDYRLSSSRFRVEFLSDLNNKFLELDIKKRNELKQIYPQPNRAEFHKRMSAYVKENGVLEKIQEFINGHHRLDRRKKIFSEAFAAYSGNSKYLFCNVIPSQIEGIFYDYCLELGIAEESVNNATLSEKLQLIINKNPAYSEYEYYNFRFPLIRNRAAHGRLIEDDIDYLADYLLLDLYDVCRLITSNNLRVNKAISVVNVVKDDMNNPKALVRYCLFRDIDIPSFYLLEQDIQKIKEKIYEQPFWDYLDELISKGNEKINVGVLHIVKNLERLEINKPNCVKVFKMLSSIDPTGFDEEDFLDTLNYL